MGLVAHVVVRERKLESNFRADSLFAAVEKYDASLRISSHEHERPYVSIVLAGGYHEHCGIQEFECSEDTFTFHPAGERHSNRMAPHDTKEVYVTLLRDDWPRLPHNRLDWRHTLARTTAVRIQNEIAHPDDLTEDAIASLIQYPLLISQRDKWAEVNTPFWLRRVHEQLKADPTRAYRITELASEAGVSAGHLSRTFRHRYGCGIIEFIRQSRLELAVSEFSCEPRPIGDIAIEVGFADQSHFTRAFRKAYGKTPREFLKHLPD